MNPVPLDQLSFEAFSQLEQAVFRVGSGSEDWLELKLVEITPPRFSAGGGGNNSKHENFALLFRGPADRLLAQGIYMFEVAPLGRFELFLVPVGLAQNGAQYQVTFNRLVPAGQSGDGKRHSSSS